MLKELLKERHELAGFESSTVPGASDAKIKRQFAGMRFWGALKETLHNTSSDIVRDQTIAGFPHCNPKLIHLYSLIDIASRALGRA